MLKIKVQTTDESLMNKLVFSGAAQLDYRASGCCEKLLFMFHCSDAGIKNLDKEDGANYFSATVLL